MNDLFDIEDRAEVMRRICRKPKRYELPTDRDLRTTIATILGVLFACVGFIVISILTA